MDAVSGVFSSKKKYGIWLLFFLSCGRLATHSQISKAMRARFHRKISTSIIYRYLNFLEKMNAVECNNHRWSITPFGESVLHMLNGENIRDGIK